jgi:hypothetical protein
MISRQPDLFDPPAIQRAAIIPAGAVFQFAGRPLRVRRVWGSQSGDVVIVEELVAFGKSLAGQYGIWSVEAVSRALAGKEIAPWRK